MGGSIISLEQKNCEAIDSWTQKGLLTLDKEGFYTNHLDEIVNDDLEKKKWQIPDILPYLNQMVYSVDRVHKLKQVKPSVIIDLGFYDSISDATLLNGAPHSTIPPALYLIDRNLDQLCEPGEIFMSTLINSSFTQAGVFFHSYHKVVRHVVDGRFEQEFNATICIDVFSKRNRAHYS